jgi:hypothetical protein
VREAVAAERPTVGGPDAHPRWRDHRGAGEAPALRPAGRRARPRAVRVQTAKRAYHAKFVTSMGRYTADTVQFAVQVGTTLVDGEELLRIIGTGRRGEALELPTPTADSTPSCPACGAAMVRRTARQGPGAGHDFWGRSTFPTCHGTVTIHGRGADRALTAANPERTRCGHPVPGRGRSRSGGTA